MTRIHILGVDAAANTISASKWLMFKVRLFGVQLKGLDPFDKKVIINLYKNEYYFIRKG